VKSSSIIPRNTANVLPVPVGDETSTLCPAFIRGIVQR
jgi:hypothetical protein